MLPPLPERMRPKNLSEYVGQRHLVGEGCILRNMIDSGNLSSFILWGPPGVGKTTLARIVSNSLERVFFTLSAVSAGVKEVREVIDAARKNIFSNAGAPVLFIDEIHRFNKAQQDALLGAVESGTVVLIGATTENPSFEVITPLLSRCQVFVLKSLDAEDLDLLLQRAVREDVVLKERNVQIKEKEALLRQSGGDARKLLNILEIVVDAKLGSKITPEQLSAFKHAKADAVVAPVRGQVFWEFNGEGECAPSVEPYIGKEYKEGDVFCYIQAPWGEFVEVPADMGGKLVEIGAKQGSKVRKGDVVAYIERAHE